MIIAQLYIVHKYLYFHQVFIYSSYIRNQMQQILKEESGNCTILVYILSLSQRRHLGSMKMMISTQRNQPTKAVISQQISSKRHYIQVTKIQINGLQDKEFSRYNKN